MIFCRFEVCVVFVSSSPLSRMTFFFFLKGGPTWADAVMPFQQKLTSSISLASTSVLCCHLSVAPDDAHLNE